MGKSYGALALIKALTVAYIITGIALFILAFLMYKMGLSTSAVDFGVTFVYIFATAVGGLIVGKSMKQKKFLWGLFGIAINKLQVVRKLKHITKVFNYFTFLYKGP